MFYKYNILSLLLLLTYKTVIISIAHVMKKQEVRFTSAHAQYSGKPYVSYWACAEFNV